MNLVVGSGPAGIACAAALLDAGERVTLLDAGLSLEPDRLAAKARLAVDAPAAWDPADVARLQEAPPPVGGVPDKRAYGSDYPFRHPAAATRLSLASTGLRPSYAAGGFSAVWGSAILPYTDRDLAGWPIATRDLAAAYAAVARLLPLSARRDGLETRVPLARDPDGALPLSRQAQRLLDTTERHRGALEAAGLQVGQARLAVEPRGCLRCGLCLTGCPRDLIYNATASRDRLVPRGLITRTGLIVRAVRESADGVVVEAVGPDGTAQAIPGTRVFLGAGPINTTEIVLRSLGWFYRTVTLKDSQYFLMPVFGLRGMPGVETEALHTLAQAFLELDDAAIGPGTIHLQAYSYNAMMRALVLARLGVLRHVVPVSRLLGRLMLLQGYLHSDHSGTIAATLRRDRAGDLLDLAGAGNPATAPMIAAVRRKLTRLSLRTGIIPIRPLVDVTLPGRGFHSGGSFPMAGRPAPGQSDRLGRPHGLARVHCIDATIFPTVPATTITLTVMANAYRIGAAVAGGAS